MAAYFDDQGIPVAIAKVGFKYRSFQLNVEGAANRVCFIPGEFKGGSGALAPRPYGTISKSTRNSSQVVNPRELAEWVRPCTISVWSAPDPSAPQEEDLALALAEDLLEKVIRGLYSAAVDDAATPAQSFAVAGAWSLGDVTVQAPPNESSFGVELLVGLTLRGPFFDLTRDIVFPIPKTGTVINGIEG